MKVFFTLIFTILFTFFAGAQKYNGQWKGGFVDASSAFTGLATSNIDYVLEIECKGKDVTGYSYTYFSDGTKQYYTICKLKGFLDKKKKEIMVTEYERTKSNTPPDFRNCFQTHLLKYTKLNKDSEQLAGSWIPAPDQSGDCGKGRTILYRKIFKKPVTPIIKGKTPVKKSIPNSPDRKKIIVPANPKKSNSQTIPSTKKITPPPIKNENSTKRFKDSVKEQSFTLPPRTFKEEPMIAPGNFQPRVKSLIKTLEIDQETITVDFYDNGAVDGDSITVFFNGKIVVSHLGLTEKPASFTLKIDKSLPYNELVMYAENMGTIPPNTALMVVKDGKKQFEVNITSDTERSGTIRFHYKGAN